MTRCFQCRCVVDGHDYKIDKERIFCVSCYLKLEKTRERNRKRQRAEREQKRLTDGVFYLNV